VLQQSDGLRLHQLVYHVAEHGPNRVEALVSMANIGEARLVQKDLLHDKNSDGFGEFRAGLHNTKAERDDLGGEQEVNHSVVLILLRNMKFEMAANSMVLTLTSAPITPNDVSRKYSKGRVLEVVFKKG
jgi:hypothetical protein